MYFPYFRGKQFELITIRETASLLAASNFVPIIEPVRESLGGLERTLRVISDAGGRAIVIVNPHHGDHGDDGANISALLQGGFIGNDKISAGILLHSSSSFADAQACFETHKDHHPTFVHAGFNEPKALAQYLGDDLPSSTHVFVSSSCRHPLPQAFQRQHAHPRPGRL
ncbi:sce7725 family protein [Labrys miyagiensis]